MEICRSPGNIEIGGIIIGIYDQEHRYALVRTISDAPSDSLRGCNWFQRGVRRLQELLNQLWYKKRYFYLGEWRFHPNNSAQASLLDIEQMKKLQGQKVIIVQNLYCSFVAGIPTSTGTSMFTCLRITKPGSS